MANPRKLICPIDFSHASLAAARYAVDLARTLGASVELVHVYHVPLHRSAVNAPRSVSDLSAEQRKEIDHEFRQFVADLDAVGVPVQTSLTVGVPAEETIAAAQRVGADMIVLGSVGHSGAHLLLGSVVERVLRLSELPVLVVRDVPGSASPAVE